MRTVSVTFIMLALLGATAMAGNGGSAYSAFGIGDVRYFPSARSAGMGFTGIGIPSAVQVNSLTPAAWTRIKHVRIEATGLYEGIRTSETDRSLYQGRGLFSGALLAIPVSPENGIVFVGGFTPYSYTAYNVSFFHSQANLEYQINEIGSGGLSKGQLGLSFMPFSDLSVGASFNYLFGKSTVERRFLPLTSNSPGATLTINEDNRGVNFTVGGQFNGFGRLSESLAPLSLGFVLSTKANMYFDLTNIFFYETAVDSLFSAERKFTIPLAFGIGAGYQIQDRWILAADYYMQKWSDARYDGQPFESIRDAHRFGIGAEKLPLRDASSWWDKLAYRLGFAYEATYYKFGTEPINGWAVTGGVTMPLFGDNRLNLALEYGERGKKTTQLVKDSIIRVAISLTLSEPWFVRYEEE